VEYVAEAGVEGREGGFGHVGDSHFDGIVVIGVLIVHGRYVQALSLVVRRALIDLAVDGHGAADIALAWTGQRLGLLKNRLYVGEVEHKGAAFEGQYEAIMDVEVFERVMSTMKRNTKAHGPSTRAKYGYLLTGVVRWACGCALTPSTADGRGGRYHYYRCVGIQKRPGHECVVRPVRAERTDELALDVVREAARDPSLLTEVVEEAKRMSQEMVSPLQTRITQLRRELTQASDAAERTVRQILSAGLGASPTAKRLLAEAELRQAQLRASLATAEGELATRQTEQLDLEVMVDAIRGFDLAFDHLTLVEKREFIQLMCHQVTVHPDRIVVELYEGRSATRWLAGHPKVQAVPNVPADVPGRAGDRERNDETPGVNQGSHC
jgi:hypothetical protein